MVCAMCGFLGMTSYYRKLMHSYDEIATLLTQLLKCEAFGWTSEVAAAFKFLEDGSDHDVGPVVARLDQAIHG
jgi:hypothetical protein